MGRRPPLPRFLALVLLALATLVVAPLARAQEPVEPAAAGWCLPELVTLEGDVCWAPAPTPAATTPAAVAPSAATPMPRRTLVIFLHGLLDDGAQWQLPLQRGMLAMAKHHGFALLAPRGLNGVGPGRLPRQIAWPAREDVRDQEEALLAKIMRARREAEAREGARYDEVFVFGFSNGAYYASSLALRGRLSDVDGYGVFAGGSAKSPPSASGAARKPIFVGVASADRTTVQRSRELVRALARSGWPHRAMEAKVGHTVADAHVRAALAWLHARAAGLPDPPPRSSRQTAPPRRAAKRSKR
jgi:predicted esterase